MKACKVGCIGCKMCEKACQFDAVKVLDNVAHIDPGKMYRMRCMCGKMSEESYSLERIKVEDGEKT